MNQNLDPIQSLVLLFLKHKWKILIFVTLVNLISIKVFLRTEKGFSNEASFLLYTNSYVGPENLQRILLKLTASSPGKVSVKTTRHPLFSEVLLRFHSKDPNQIHEQQLLSRLEKLLYNKAPVEIYKTYILSLLNLIQNARPESLSKILDGNNLLKNDFKESINILDQALEKKCFDPNTFVDCMGNEKISRPLFSLSHLKHFIQDVQIQNVKKYKKLHNLKKVCLVFVLSIICSALVLLCADFFKKHRDLVL